MNTYPIDNLWRKGHYMQRLAENGRDFVQGKPIKSRHTIEVSPADIGELPAWILRTSSPHNCGECGRPKPQTELIAAMPHGWEIVADGLAGPELAALAESGEPGPDPAAQIAAAIELAAKPREVYAANNVEPF